MQEVPVNVFWDIENCAVPNNMKGVQVVKAIRSFAMQAGILKNISAFANLKLIKEDLRADMQESGVLLHDVTRKANSSDLAILVEILKLVIDNKPPHCIVLISGDRDFANVLSTLTFRKYQVFLVHSPQASEVLKGAATMAFEWTQLLKRGGDVWNTPNQIPLNSNNTPYLAHYEKFQPLLDFLVAKGKPQVEFSELGNLIPFNKYGYPKLKDYIFDAQGHGLVKCGANKNIHWVALVDPRPGATPAQPPPLIIPSIANPPSMGNGIPLTPGLPPLAYRAPPTDKTTIARHLVTALESLKMDYFKPTESTLQKRIKQLNLPLQKIDWEEIVSVAQQKSFCIMGEKPNRTIFPPAGPFQGVDPSHPNTDNFPPRLWKSIQQFFIEVHPVVRVGRYGFAVFLKEQGPPEVREMPLGSITELVQLALHKQLLRYHKTQVSTILPDPDNPSAFIPENSPDLRPESYHNHNNFNHNHMRTSSSSDDVENLQLSPPGTPDDTSDSEEFVEDERARLVGVTFAWPYPGNSVLVTGSFFNWRNTIALHRRERDASSTPPSPSTPTSSYTATIPNNHQNPSITSPLLLPTSSPGPAGSPLLSPQQQQQQQQQQSPFHSPSYPSPSNYRDFNNKDHFGEIGAMCEPEDVFSTVLYLPPGKYEYKFIVDGAWHYDPHQLVVTDEVGNLNNIVEIKPLSNAQLTEPLLDHEFV